jgi:hypothetical protein
MPSWAAGVTVSNMGDMGRWAKVSVIGITNSVASQRARLTCVPTGEANLSFGLGMDSSAGWYGYTGV